MFSELRISADPSAHVGSAIASALGAVGRRFGLLVRAARNRHAAAMLARLDERMLSDIGLTRGDLRDAFAEPLWRDPTCVLAERAVERRANRRGFGLALSKRASLAPSIVPTDSYRRPVTDRLSRHAR